MIRVAQSVSRQHRGPTEHDLDAIADVRVGAHLRVLTKGPTGARYVLEGSLRQAGGQLRAAVKLIDTSTGANLWAENSTRS